MKSEQCLFCGFVLTSNEQNRTECPECGESLEDLDCDKAAEALGRLIDSVGFELSILRLENKSETRRECHYTVTLTCPNSRHSFSTPYTCGVFFPIRWIEMDDKARRKFWPRITADLLAEFRRYVHTGQLSVDAAGALDHVRKIYKPALFDIVSSLLFDAADVSPYADFRTWIEESGMTWDNPADALDCFNQCQAAARFLREAFGDSADRAFVLSRML